MRVKHAQTREYMEVNALRGIVKDGAGTTLYDYFSEFGLTQIAVDFVLCTGTTQVQAKVRQVLRHVETELKGETMSGVLALELPIYARQNLAARRQRYRGEDRCIHPAGQQMAAAGGSPPLQQLTKARPGSFRQVDGRWPIAWE